MPLSRYSLTFVSLPALAALILGLQAWQPVAESGTIANADLSENKIIKSEVLGYDLQYRVFAPEGIESMSNVSVIYVTDGQWYIESGELPALMKRLISEGAIEPVVAVFVDNRDPHNLNDNRRNAQFFCNPNYISFFENELIPSIEKVYPVGKNRNSRTILGLSFGGLNSACFGIMASDTFKGIAMQSPAMRPVRTIHSQYQQSEDLDLKIFLTSGTDRDNEDATRRLRDVIKEKGYQMEYIEVPYGHNWQNWKPLLEDFLRYYYLVSNPDEGSD